MAVLSDKRILEEMERKAIIIFPYSSEQLNSGSYNIRLGDYHYMALRDAFVPGIPSKQTFYFKDTPDVTEKISGWTIKDPDEWREKVVDIFPGKYGEPPTVEPLWSRCQTGDIVLHPGDVALCHSEEFIGSLTGSITELRARSTLMRNCLSLAPSAGWGDVNFVNRWGFTIHNYGHRTIRLHSGDEIGQIVFYSIGEVNKPYKGSYAQNVSSLIMTSGEYSEYCRQLVMNWEPIQLLSSVQREAQNMLTPSSEKIRSTSSSEVMYRGESSQTRTSTGSSDGKRNTSPSEVMYIMDESSRGRRSTGKEEERISSGSSRERKSTGKEEKKVVRTKEEEKSHERSTVKLENENVLKAVSRRMMRTLNPKMESRNNKRRAVQHTYILYDTLYTIIIQTQSRQHFDLVQESEWRVDLAESIIKIVFDWATIKYGIEYDELKGLYDQYVSSKERSGFMDRNIEHQISQIYYDERDSYIENLRVN